MTPPEVDPVHEFQEWSEAGGLSGYRPSPLLNSIHWRDYSESDLINAALPALTLHFQIFRECWGNCFPFSQVKRKRVRVDMICAPKPEIQWRLGPFAIEFKRPSRPPSVKLGDHIAQALDYKATYFDGFGYMPVFLCPGIQGYKEATYEETQHYYESARRVLGGLGLGEMFVSPIGEVDMFLSADPLIRRNRLTYSASKNKKAGRGAGSFST